MAFRSEKSERVAGSVSPTSSADVHIFGQDNPVNSKLVASMMIQPFAFIAAVSAFNMAMAKQLSSLILSAVDLSLETMENAGSFSAKTSRLSMLGEKVSSQPNLRVVVDNGAGTKEELSKSAKQSKVTAKRAKPVSNAHTTETAIDDLKRISGIGPKLEKMLHDKGIHRFSDIAKLSVAKANALDNGLGLGGRIAKDQWVEKAKALAKGLA